MAFYWDANQIAFDCIFRSFSVDWILGYFINKYSFTFLYIIHLQPFVFILNHTHRYILLPVHSHCQLPILSHCLSVAHFQLNYIFHHTNKSVFWIDDEYKSSHLFGWWIFILNSQWKRVDSVKLKRRNKTITSNMDNFMKFRIGPIY